MICSSNPSSIFNLMDQPISLPLECTALNENKRDCFEQRGSFICNCYMVVLFTFYAVRSSNKLKGSLVH